jgi:hypothetical protein
MWKHGLRSTAAIERRRIAAAEGRELRAMVRFLTEEAKRLGDLS